MKKSAAGSFSFNLSLPCVREGTGESCRTPEDVRRILADTADLAQEAFTVITLNRKNKVIDRHLVTLGLLDASLIHSREVFRPAIGDGASSVIISHNLCGRPHKLCYVERTFMCRRRRGGIDGEPRARAGAADEGSVRRSRCT